MWFLFSEWNRATRKACEKKQPERVQSIANISHQKVEREWEIEKWRWRCWQWHRRCWNTCENTQVKLCESCRCLVLVFVFNLFLFLCLFSDAHRLHLYLWIFKMFECEQVNRVRWDTQRITQKKWKKKISQKVRENCDCLCSWTTYWLWFARLIYNKALNWMQRWHERDAISWWK